MKLRTKIDPKRCTLLELAYLRHGSMLKASKVVAFVIGWEVVRQELGREPSVDEYAAHWREHRATAYRHMAEFRVVFPQFETPGPVIDHLATARQTEPVAWGDLVAA